MKRKRYTEEQIAFALRWGAPIFSTRCYESTG